MKRRRLSGALVAGLMIVVAPVAPAVASADQVSAAQVRAGEWWLSKLSVEKAWSVTKGKGVTVAVIDSGVVPTPDLTGQLLSGADFSGRGAANGQRAVGGDAHGTEVGAFIAGHGHGAGDALGMMGVAPEAKLLPLVVSTDDSGGGGPANQFSTALEYAVAHGAKVVNMSLGADLSTAAIADAEAHDVVLVAATGNDGSDLVAPPANKLGVVAVAGVDENLATDSRATTGGVRFMLGPKTPATAIGGTALVGPYSTDQQRGLVTATTSGYGLVMGTSYSAAIVSGIVALIRAAHPDMSAANVINTLLGTARHHVPAGTGYSEKQGFGVPNAYAAVTTSYPSVCANPLGSLASPQSLGVWAEIAGITKKYAPTCSSSTPTTSTPSTSSVTTPPVSKTAGPTGTASGGSGGGVPGWVWPVIAVVVIVAGGGGYLLARRGRHSGRPPSGY